MNEESPPPTPTPPTSPMSPTPTPTPAEVSYAKSIVFLGKGRSPNYVIETTRLPTQLSPGQVLVRVELATICGSDLHTLTGTRTNAHPCVLGHEGCGVVVESQREGVKEGQRVTWGMCASCDKCLPCSLGLSNKCKTLMKCGHTVVTTAPLFGTYSTHTLCPAGAPIVPLPAELTPALAAPVNCALATMVNALTKLPSTPRPGQPGANVAFVQGAGLLGVYGCVLLREAGYARVLCSDPNRTRLKRVVEFGGTPVLPDQEDEVIPPGSVDVVLEVCGKKEVVGRGVRALRPGGTYVLVGLVHSDSRLDLTAQAIILKCLTLTGVHNYTGQQLREAVTFLARHHHRYPFASLVGPTYPLSDFRNAVEVAHSGQFFRVALSPQQ